MEELRLTGSDCGVAAAGGFVMSIIERKKHASTGVGSGCPHSITSSPSPHRFRPRREQDLVLDGLDDLELLRSSLFSFHY